MTQLTLVAIITAKSGLETELGQRLAALVEPTRQETGCIKYNLHHSQTDEAVWLLYEKWASREALEAHFAMPYLQAFLVEKDRILAKDMQLMFLDVIGTSD